MDPEKERDIEKTLADIFEYIGANKTYATYGALKTMLERLIDRNK